MNKPLNIIFMGTPQFAANCLDALLKTQHNIIAVFCQSDKLVGRKQTLKSPEVKVLALEHGIPVYQPKTLRNDKTAELIKSMNPDIIVVVAYGKLLPKAVLDIPPLGCVNIHGSILPKYRGAAPIQWAIVNGEVETGVTLMKMDEGMDTGDIIKIEKINITENDNSQTMFDKLSVLGAKMIVELINSDIDTITATPQDNSQATTAPMISKADARINWNMPASVVLNLINGMNPWPIAYTSLGDDTLKIFSASLTDLTTNYSAGTVIKAKKQLQIACGNISVLELNEVQLTAGKRMASSSFLNGNKIKELDILK